jgi:pimeloyl-ACP methyl ester carboxylesterase
MNQATHMAEIRRRAACPRHSGPGILPGARAWHHLCNLVSTITLGFLTMSCSHAAPLLKQETRRGQIQYSLHSPETPARQHVILAHGFLRNPQTMDHLAEAFAKNGIETACIKLKRSTLWNGHHAENARDMIALRESLGWKNVTYAGFSAGGLSALVAAAEDPSCTKLILLDPVDHASLGMDAAAKIRIPAIAILGQPGPGNANRNAAAMLASIRGCRIVEIKAATHCDFEARPSALCHQLTGSKPDATRTAKVHKTLLRETALFLKVQSISKP